MVTYVFPGQGSQKKGMGEGLFEEFKELTEKADEILGYSIKELCLEDPEDKLGQTQFTQPALYVVNAFAYMKKIIDTGKNPDFVAGHSLGEYNALFASGAFDFETGLKLVKKRGELMSQASGGGMAAVIGLSEESIRKVLEENDLKVIDIANYNTPSQIVLSGPKKDIENAKPIFEAAGAKMYMPLKVSGAFHSRYMQDSKKMFEEYLDSFEFPEMAIPVISNVSARPYEQGKIKENLAEQITNSVKWTESIRYLMGKGQMEFEQVGPGTVLTGLIRSIQSEAEPLKVDETRQEDVNVKLEEPKTEEASGHAADSTGISALTLGDAEFKKDYNLKYAYLAGAMYRGIASKEMVVKMGKAGMMGFLGTGGMKMDEAESAIQYIQKELSSGEAYGVNILHSPNRPDREDSMVDLLIKYGVKVIETAAYMNVTPSLVRYRLSGLRREGQGGISIPNRIIAKLSRPEVAETFLRPAPEQIVEKLLAEGKVTQEEAELSKGIPMADDISVEADSGGHTDSGVAYALMPAMINLRDEMMKKYNYSKKIRIGAAGGIGTPEAAAAAFVLGADFIVTGSINQCTVEAGTSESAKNLLQEMDVQDTVYAPAGDMFEMGARVQVLKKGLFFPARANKLYELYRQYNSLDEIDEKTRTQLQERYFKRSFDEIYNEVKLKHPSIVEKAEKNPKSKMAAVFRWYFEYATDLALKGDEENKVDYQIFCGPALGAFNRWVKGSHMESWKNRHVDETGLMLMDATAELLVKRFRMLSGK